MDSFEDAICSAAEAVRATLSPDACTLIDSLLKYSVGVLLSEVWDSKSERTFHQNEPLTAIVILGRLALTTPLPMYQSITDTMTKRNTEFAVEVCRTLALSYFNTHLVRSGKLCLAAAVRHITYTILERANQAVHAEGVTLITPGYVKKVVLNYPDHSYFFREYEWEAYGWQTDDDADRLAPPSASQ
jgi:hypothetical protein